VDRVRHPPSCSRLATTCVAWSARLQNPGVPLKRGTRDRCLSPNSCRSSGAPNFLHSGPWNELSRTERLARDSQSPSVRKLEFPLRSAGIAFGRDRLNPNGRSPRLTLHRGMPSLAQQGLRLSPKRGARLVSTSRLTQNGFARSHQHTCRNSRSMKSTTSRMSAHKTRRQRLPVNGLASTC
jgi:hypothetical protein